MQNRFSDCVWARGELRHCGLFLHALLPGIRDIKPVWQGTVMSISAGPEGSQTQRQSGACPWCHPCTSGNPLKNVCVLLNLCVWVLGEGRGMECDWEEWIINDVLLNTQTHKPDTPYCITARRRAPLLSIQHMHAAVCTNMQFLCHLGEPFNNFTNDWDEVEILVLFYFYSKIFCSGPVLSHSWFEMFSLRFFSWL